MRQGTEPISPVPTVPVKRPVLLMRWQSLTAVHWALDPAIVAARLPDGLVPDVHAGRAYVGLVPFEMAGIRLGSGHLPLPNGRFPETNVRTYVVGPDGGRGVYFHSLDITRLAPVVVARLGYQLPYDLSRMRLARRGDRLAYRATRRWPAPRGASSQVIVEVGPRLSPDDTTELDHFLSARWSLYTVLPSGAVWRARVDHESWVLYAARLRHLEDEFVTAAGYPTGLGVPDHVRVADALSVRVGAPQRVG